MSLFRLETAKSNQLQVPQHSKNQAAHQKNCPKPLRLKNPRELLVPRFKGEEPKHSQRQHTDKKRIQFEGGCDISVQKLMRRTESSASRTLQAGPFVQQATRIKRKMLRREHKQNDPTDQRRAEPNEIDPFGQSGWRCGNGGGVLHVMRPMQAISQKDRSCSTGKGLRLSHR
jgi:hypothetical protein